MIRIALMLLVALTALVSPARAQGGGNDVMLVLDASGSMWGLIEGRSKIAIARQSAGTLLGKLRSGDRVGLMAYGHRQKGDCKDIEVLLPVGADPAQLRAKIDALVPKGKTPLAESLRQAARALRHTERKATVILVSDGIETCDADPCAVAAELKKSGVGFVAHVVGFDVADPAAKRQLQCIARNTGGIYLDAKNAGSLEQALGKTIEAAQGRKVASEAPAKEPEDPLKGKNLRGQARLAPGLDPVTDESLHWALHKAGADGEPGEWIETYYGPLATAAQPGRYILVVTYGMVERKVQITVERGKPANVDLNLDAGFVVSEGTIGGSQAKADDPTWEVIAANGDIVATVYDPVPRFILPAGKYTLKLSKGTASASKEFTLAAGDSINLALTVDAGKLIVSALYAAGGPAVKDDLAAELRRPPAIDGEAGEWVGTQYGAQASFDIAAGPYDVVASVGRASVMERVEVKPGQTLRLTVTLNAGVAAIAAPGATSIEIVGAERDINNERESMHHVYDAATSIALPAGSYVAVAEFSGGKKVEKPFAVTAGKRAEVAVAP